MAKNLLNHARVVNDGNDAHRALTDGAAKRVTDKKLLSGALACT
jgi:hypothetical protein